MTAPSSLPPLPCYLNGEFTNLAEAKVSVLDRGFVFGDGVYEVVPVYNGRPFRFAEHMARLDRSLGEMRIDNPMTHAQWGELVGKLITAYAAHAKENATATDLLVYFQVSRGVAMRDPVRLPGLAATVFAGVSRISGPSPKRRENGVACITAKDCRWEMPYTIRVRLVSSM